MTCIIALVFFFLIADFPEQSTFLSEEEKQFVNARLHQDVGNSAIDEKVTAKDIWDALKDCMCTTSGFYLELTLMYYNRQIIIRSVDVSRMYCSCLWLVVSTPPT